MKKVIVLLIISLMLFSFNVYAQENEKLTTEDSKSENLSLSQEKSFSDSAREELLGIASKFDSREEQNINDLNFELEDFSLAETTLDNSQHLNLIKDLNFAADYSQEEAEKLETAADFKLEYALNSNTSFRAGYSILNEEWWGIQNKADLMAAENLNEEELPEEKYDPEDNNYQRVYQNESESSRSLGVAYKSSDRFTVSADFIDNKEFGSYYNQDLEISGDSAVLGLEYSYPEGSTIRASYQVERGENATHRITGLGFTFNNLATFSASYKLFDPSQIEDGSIQTQTATAWDLDLGVNLNEGYGMALGYELIESEDKKEAERKIKASFEINF